MHMAAKIGSENPVAFQRLALPAHLETRTGQCINCLGR